MKTLHHLCVLSFIAAFAVPSAVTADPVADKKAEYASVFQSSGLLLRAGYVCENDNEEMFKTGFGVQARTEELKDFNGVFPETTKQWMMEGAGMMNTMVLTKGRVTACFQASLLMFKLGKLMSQDTEKQRRK